jgi:hypothetical protein
MLSTHGQLHDVLQMVNRKLGISAVESHVSRLGKRRDSAMYIVDTGDASIGHLFLKLARSKRRAANWDPMRESEHLERLARTAPSSDQFNYLHSLCASKKPPFLALRYFPSRTLRQQFDTASRGTMCEEDCNRLVDSFFLAGRWLGMSYRNAPHLPVDFDPADRIRAAKDRHELCPSSKKPNLSRSSWDSMQSGLADAVLGAPSFFHGDFNLDNILVHSSGQMCFVDPEPIRLGVYADFIHFRQSLAILANRNFRRKRAIPPTLFGAAFCDGFAHEYPAYRTVAEVYRLAVLEKMLWYHTVNTGNWADCNIRRLIYHYDQRRLMTTWQRWLEEAPTDRDLLWSFMRTSI